MENYGKNGKEDYTRVQGRVNTTFSAGTELFQVPAFEQRAQFTDESCDARKLVLKAANNTEFSVSPLYSYAIIENRAVDVVFQNARLGSGSDFMLSLEDNILEPHIYDLIKEESRKYVTDTLMAAGGSLRFENRVQELVKKSFEEKGLKLINFSANLDFSEKVKNKIDSRNEVNTNISVIDQKIIEQRKQNQLVELEAIENKQKTEGLTPQILKEMELKNQADFIKKWDGHTPLYGNLPVTIMKKE